MRVIKKIEELREFVSSMDGSVGFVPTMGALHDGHTTIIKKAVSENDNVIVSVFVNPTQFLPGEDLDKYPRQEEEDAKICESCGVKAVFIPSVNEMYFQNEPLIAAPSKIASMLEGKTRPGHFDGVLRVLMKLFNLIKPTRAYFGKKDAQQLVIVQNMVETMFLNLQIVPCDIVRESDGLALSSRNRYLSEEDKFNALRISRSLFNASNLIRSGELDVKKIKEKMLGTLEPLQVSYVAIVDRNFNELLSVETNNTIILVAAYVGKTRLIDNIWI